MTKDPSYDADGSKPEPHNKHLAERQHLRGDVNFAAELFAHYPEAVREDAIWLWFFCKTKCSGEHALLWKIAVALGLKDRSGKNPSDQYWYQVASGRYFKPGGDAQMLKRYVSAIRGYALRFEQTGMLGHVDTENWVLYRDYVDSRRTFDASCRVGAVEGLTGSQKTWCGKHYAALHNHKETVHMEAPARNTRARVVQKLAELYLIAESKNIGGKEIDIERFLRGAVTVEQSVSTSAKPKTIILDNVQRLFRPNVPPDQQPVFNYLHEMQDDIGFCLILQWVPSFTRIITSDHPYWAQWVGRFGGEDAILRLDQKLSKRDILKFAMAAKVDDDKAALPILTNWASTKHGIRIFAYKLEQARKLANQQGHEEIRLPLLQKLDIEPTPAALLTEGDES